MRVVQHLVVDVLIDGDVSRDEVVQAVTDRVLALWDEEQADAQAVWPVSLNMLDFSIDFSKRPV